MNSAEKPHWDADSSVGSVVRWSPVFRISKPFLSKLITPSRFLFSVSKALGTKERDASQSLLFVQSGTTLSREKLKEGKGESQVQMTIDSELYIDSGLLSGLAAMSEVRELLDELYGSLT